MVALNSMLPALLVVKVEVATVSSHLEDGWQPAMDSIILKWPTSELPKKKNPKKDSAELYTMSVEFSGRPEKS